MEFNYDSGDKAQPVVPERDDGAAGGGERQRDKATGQFTSTEKMKADQEAADAAWLARMQKQNRDAVLVTDEGKPSMADGDKPDATAGGDGGDGALARGVDETAIKVAREHAARLQIPKSSLERMTTEEIAQAAPAWAKAVKANDDVSRRLAESEKKIAELGSATQEPSKDAQPFDVAALVQPVVAGYDEETKKTFVGVADAIAKPLLKELAAEKAARASQEARLKALEAREERNAEAESIKDELKGTFPQLGKPEVWSAVRAKAEAITSDKLPLRDAIELVAAKYAPTAADSQVSDSTRNRRNGVASTNGLSPRKGGVTQDDRDREVYNRLHNRTS